MLNTRQNNNNNRRRGRTRGAPGGNNNNRQENGSRIDNRARNNAPQMLEKYRNMARDAQTQGDRVMTEYYLQFADHYFRIVAESRARFEEQRRQRGDWSEDGEDGEGMDQLSNDGDLGGESDQDRQAYYQDRPRRDNRNENRTENRTDSRGDNRGDRNGQDRPAQGNERSGSDRNDRDRNDRSRPNHDRAPRESQPAEDTVDARPAEDSADFERAPRPRGRRAVRSESDAPAEIDASVLPPALGIGSPISVPDANDGIADMEVAEKPKVRRPRRPAAAAPSSDI